MSLEPDELAHAWLETIQGDDHGSDRGDAAPTKFALAAATTTLGRVAGNTHVLPDKTISRQHAKIFVRDGRHWLADQNSTAGTFVNGQRITLQTLTAGDEIRLGTTLLRYRLPSAAPIATAAPPAPPRATEPPRRVPPPAPAEPPTGSFELELPDAGAPPRRAVAPLASGPPPAPRSGLTEAGEDPFATVSADGNDEGAAPTIELRGATARNLGTSGAAARKPGAPVAAASARSATTHLPPPIAVVPKRSGAFAFLGDDLNQRGGLARFAAIVLALAAAAGLGWLALRTLQALPSATEGVEEDDTAPTGPVAPQLPPRR